MQVALGNHRMIVLSDIHEGEPDDKESFIRYLVWDFLCITLLFSVHNIHINMHIFFNIINPIIQAHDLHQPV